MRDTIRYTWAAIVLLAMTGAASAQGQPVKVVKFDADRTFLMTAGQSGVAEVMLANLATKKAASDEVRKLAQMLEKDHTATNQELKSLATAKAVVLATTPDAEHQQLYNRLEALDGAAFDRAYASAMVDAHKKSITLFEQASVSKDAEVKAFAEKKLPTLREHLKHAQHAQTTVGGASSTSGTVPPKPQAPPK
jgi:putative membrane protein